MFQFLVIMQPGCYQFFPRRFQYSMTTLALIGIITSFLPCVVTAELKAESSSRPNIVLIMADDMGYSDIGCYGGEIDTPHLNKLAAEGLRFTQFYNNAKCSETRAALLTGLYHHQSNNLKVPNHVTLAEVLRSAGYSTQMVGKWHVASTPPQRGFDRYFGFLGGAVNFFTGIDFGNGKNLMRLDEKVFTVPKKGFYTTDAFTDYAIEFLDAATQKDKPFFLYVALNAPHFPLHALPEDIAKYRGKYRLGWDRLRAIRHKKMTQMGLIDPHWPLSPRDSIVPAWTTLTKKAQQDEDLLMAVFAAMVDRLDQNIGRLMNHLDTLGVAENTVVIFLSDNGACPYDFNHTPDIPPGPAESARTYDSEWANAGNTPFRLYKQWSHEGGISTPFIVRWPAKIKTGGKLNSQLGHLIDIMPTLVELAEAKYPSAFANHKVLPMEGISLVPAFTGKTTRTNEPIFWEFRGNHAVRTGKWKLVAERSKDWELYDMQADRSELNDLIEKHPQRAARMAALYDAWSTRTGSVPHKAARKMEPSTQKR